jgi:hypothetical protein
VDTLQAPQRTTDALELRRLIPRYLTARERFEETGYPHGDAAYEYSTASEALVHVLVAVGAYGTDEAAFAAVEAMTAPYLASMFVEAWADREGYLTELGSGEIARIADRVTDLVAEGARLDDLGMADLVAPYLPGGAA